MFISFNPKTTLSSIFVCFNSSNKYKKINQIKNRALQIKILVLEKWPHNKSKTKYSTKEFALLTWALKLVGIYHPHFPKLKSMYIKMSRYISPTFNQLNNE